MNRVLGRGYTLVHRFETPEEFRRCFESYFEKPHVADGDPEADDDTRRVYAFISDDNGQLQPLYTGQKAFIMTENGATFANVSC